MRRDAIDEKVDEIVVIGNKTQGKSEIAKEIKRFWVEIGGMYDNDPVARERNYSIIQKDLSEVEMQLIDRKVRKC